LAAIGASFYITALRTGRDQTRAKHLNDIKSSLEFYYQTKRVYPPTASFYDELTPLLNKFPTDPLDPKQNYAYQALPSGCDNQTALTRCTNFVYCAYKESVTTFDNPTDCATLTCKAPSTSCNMGVTVQ
jgi:hypothetical protein